MNALPETISLETFSLELSDEVTDRIERGLVDITDAPSAGFSAADVALAQVMLEQLEDEGLTSDWQLCPYADVSGRKRCSITAYSLPDGADRLDLFLSVFNNNKCSIETVGSSELARLTGKAARFFDYAARADLTRFSSAAEVQDAARRIHAAIQNLSAVRVFILTNSVARDRAVDSLEIHGIPVVFEVFDIERLLRLSQTATSRQDIEIDFVSIYGRPLPCLEMTPRAPEYDTYLAIFSGKLLVDLYERYGQRLFEFNVRSFLQATGKVNKGIRDTLRNEPDRFMAYNNGIVATADSIDVGLFHGETTIAKIVGLQIVNGAQTTASIYRACKVDKTDLSGVSVAVKITKVAPDKLQLFVPLISRFANTQNVIQAADLSANNEFHIELERLSLNVWCPGQESRWFYERARGAYNDALQREGSTPAKRREFKRITPASQKLTKTELAKYFMAWIGRPHTVSMGAQKNFSTFMSEITELFPADWKPDRAFYERVIGQAILFRACERTTRIKKFPAYRANIAVYSYALLSHWSKGELDFGLVWREQGLSTELTDIIGDIVSKVDAKIRASAESRNVTEWCKNPECWEAVRSIPAEASNGNAPELPGAAREKERTAAREESVRKMGTEESAAVDGWEDADAIDECMKQDAATWAKLNYWGVSTGSLDYYERGVAHTLSEYAASGWSRTPSAKQARIGARVLSRARDEKLL